MEQAPKGILWISGRTFQKEGTARVKALRSSRNSREARVAGAESSGNGEVGDRSGRQVPRSLWWLSCSEQDGKHGTALTWAGCAVLKVSWILAEARLTGDESESEVKRWIQMRKNGQYLKRGCDVTGFWIYFEGQHTGFADDCMWGVRGRGLRTTLEHLAFMEMERMAGPFMGWAAADLGVGNQIIFYEAPC